MTQSESNASDPLIESVTPAVDLSSPSAMTLPDGEAAKNGVEVATYAAIHVEETYVQSPPLRMDLPDPDTFSRYPKVIQDFFLTTARDNAKHDREEDALDGRAEREDLARSRTHQRLSIIFGFCVAISGLVATVILAWLGTPVVAGIVGALDLVALTTVFVTGSRSSDRERKIE